MHFNKPTGVWRNQSRINVNVKHVVISDKRTNSSDYIITLFTANGNCTGFGLSRHQATPTN